MAAGVTVASAVAVAVARGVAVARVGEEVGVGVGAAYAIGAERTVIDNATAAMRLRTFMGRSRRGSGASHGRRMRTLYHRVVTRGDKIFQV
ncbi:hypothetical protein GCM10028815_22480 [Mariniluteicoccus flavus]